MRRRAVMVAVGAMMLLAGCGNDLTHSAGSSGSVSVPPAQVHLAPADGTTHVSPTEPLEITVSGGRLGKVTLVDAEGTSFSGGVTAEPADDADPSPSASSSATSSAASASTAVASSAGSDAAGQPKVWTPEKPLAYGTRYTLTATALNSANKQVKASTTFTTVEPRTQSTPSIGPLDGTTVGVGMPIRVYFDQPVADKAAVESHLRVTSSTPTDGAWNWFSSKEVHYRPSTYWPAHAQVTLDAALYGVDFGDGVWGKKDRTISFTIGDKHVSVADAAAHTLQVYSADQLVRTFPMSAGSSVNPTRNGPHVVTEKNADMVMDSSTFGLAVDAPGGYRADVKWATRISNNGEFVHAAPWSVAQQGHSNVSHGCINLSTDNAQWFFDFSNPGDVVEVQNSVGPKLSQVDGDIYDWAIPWSQWRAGSALK